MTPARQARKSRAALAFLVPWLWLAAAGPSAAATTERIVTDWRTGLAIFGYDPVAYFTDAKPTRGLAAFELRHAGVIWRFRNAGNRAAFAADPDIYMPRFGGYDPVGVARGVATPGHPDLWVRAGNRLYLFHTAEDRDSFAKNPAPMIGAAEVRWPDLLRVLAP
ncbi:MAG: hypothetical protein M5U07_07695 [Xanthobacteraceae bacterium]|nr:hypothetical protein [Xanthobacteraceae bacterium]PWB57326.1 MAG: hypothetical protein C3F17_20875 [Bradyrhizobiaceae bacterium]